MTSHNTLTADLSNQARIADPSANYVGPGYGAGEFFYAHATHSKDIVLAPGYFNPCVEYGLRPGSLIHVRLGMVGETEYFKVEVQRVPAGLLRNPVSVREIHVNGHTVRNPNEDTSSPTKSKAAA